jgi:hypothetical protein
LSSSGATPGLLGRLHLGGVSGTCSRVLALRATSAAVRTDDHVIALEFRALASSAPSEEARAYPRAFDDLETRTQSVLLCQRSSAEGRGSPPPTPRVCKRRRDAPGRDGRRSAPTACEHLLKASQRRYGSAALRVSGDVTRGDGGTIAEFLIHTRGTPLACRFCKPEVTGSIPVRSTSKKAAFQAIPHE